MTNEIFSDTQVIFARRDQPARQAAAALVMIRRSRKAPFCRQSRQTADVNQVPTTDSCTAATISLFYYFVGASDQYRWNFEAKRL
jgi:hypothetical protein